MDVSIFCNVSSLVNQPGRSLPQTKNIPVMKTARTEDRNKDFQADMGACSTLPFPRWNARRMAPASDKPSVADSKRSHMASRIPHAATSAGPRNAAKIVSASHSPYSNRDPMARGIAVANTYLTALVFCEESIGMIW